MNPLPSSASRPGQRNIAEEEILDGKGACGTAADDDARCLGIFAQERGHAALGLRTPALHLDRCQLALAFEDEADLVVALAPPLHVKAEVRSQREQPGPDGALHEMAA